jgi:hypothetical protein
MNKLKQLSTTILIVIIIILAAIFVYEHFIIKGNNTDNTKLGLFENSIKNYEKEISSYKQERVERQKHIDSLTIIKNNLVVENDSLKKEIIKSKNKRNETIRNLDNVDVKQLYKLFSDYKPGTSN